MTPSSTSDPGSGIRARTRAALRATLVVSSLALAFIALGAGYGRYRFGSLAASLAFLRGERLLAIEPNQTIVGAHVGGQVVARYTLRNLSAHPIRLVGMISSCTCTAIEGLPMTVAASETKAVFATIDLSKKTSDFTGSIRLFTDDPGSPEIGLAYEVRVAQFGNSGTRQGQ